VSSIEGWKQGVEAKGERFKEYGVQLSFRGDRNKIRLSGWDDKEREMLTQYIQAALERAHYEIIKDDEPFYGEVPDLAGVWASGETLEACRNNLAEAIEDWLLFSIAKAMPIPDLGGISIRVPEKVAG
jgi:predicted RNase H-like HicB family nuclease